MKKLIAIAVLVLMSMFITSFNKYDSNVPFTSEDIKLYDSLKSEGYVMLPEIIVTYDTIKCKCEVTINRRSEMGRKGMEFRQRGRMNSMIGRGQMNHRQFKGDTTKFERPMMMGRGQMNQRGMDPKMEQMMKEHRQMMFKGDTNRFERPMRMNHR